MPRPSSPALAIPCPVHAPVGDPCRWRPGAGGRLVAWYCAARRRAAGLMGRPVCCAACKAPPPLILMGKTWLCAPCTDYGNEGATWAATVAESWDAEGIEFT